MGSCCSVSNEKSPKPVPLPKINSKIPTMDTDNTQVVTTSSFRRCISPRRRKKERVSLQSITTNYFGLLRKSEIIPEAISLKLKQLKPNFIVPETKLKDLLVISPEDYMICKVCKDILLNPQLCSKCKLFICSHCLEKTETICKHSFVKELNDYYNNIIEILSTEEFKCFNWKNGCAYLVNYSKITYDKIHNRYMTKHEQQCIHKLEKCFNPNCNYQAYSQDYREHLRKCPYSSFFCFYCKERFFRTEIDNHACFNSKPMGFSLPIRYCECGAILEWIVRDKENEDDLNRGRYYYNCNNCNDTKKERQYPPPIAKVCGCFSKLKGGIIYHCIGCSADGGIGWSCNLCGNRISICEYCITDKLEINID